MKAGKPRIIRKVTQVGSDGVPKVVRDTKNKITVERVRSQKDWVCTNKYCPRQYIYTGTTYALVIENSRTRFGSQGAWAPSYPYHFGCLPNKYKPVQRFFGKGFVS